MSSAKDRMKLAAELVSKGATMLAEPCPEDSGIQVRFRGKVYCASHDDLSGITRTAAVTLEVVTAQLREVLLGRLNETTSELGAERNLAKQEQLVELAAKYVELLQKLPQK
ncbi:MAG: hypothetical protein JRN51_10335 [Nitrososphaerota archaeon]|nr:hypothetical protein [Nitrososphaerota archaeon]